MGGCQGVALRLLGFLDHCYEVAGVWVVVRVLLWGC